MGQFPCIFFPSPQPTYTIQGFQNSKSQSIMAYRLITEDDQIIPFFFLPQFSHKKSQISAYCLMFFHGNAEDLGLCLNMLTSLRTQLNVNVCSIQYPGYGDLKNIRPCSQKMKTYAQYMYRYLKQGLGFRDQTIIIMGRSIGSGPASYLASVTQCYKLILMSPFESIKTVTNDHTCCLGICVTEMFPNIQFIKKTNAELLVIHGQIDEVIPVKNSQVLQQAYEQSKKFKGKFIYWPQMTHNRFRMQENIIRPIQSFIQIDQKKILYQPIRKALHQLIL